MYFMSLFDVMLTVMSDPVAVSTDLTCMFTVASPLDVGALMRAALTELHGLALSKGKAVICPKNKVVQRMASICAVEKK